MMAKNINKPKNSQPSWLDNQIKQYGGAFMSRLNTEIVRKNALKIFKDLASGNINYEKHSEFFRVYSFTYSLVLAANDNAYYAWAVSAGLDTFIVSNPMAANEGNKLTEISRELKKSFNAYNAASAVLNNVLIDIQNTQGQNIVPLLQQAVVTLQQYKHCFNGYFITVGRPDEGRLRVERRIIPNGQSSSNQGEGYVQETPFADENYMRQYGDIL